MGGFPFVSKNFHLFQRISKNFKEFQFVSISFRHWAMKKTAATAFLSVQHTPYLLKNSSLFSDSGVYKLSSSIRRWSKPRRRQRPSFGAAYPIFYPRKYAGQAKKYFSLQATFASPDAFIILEGTRNEPGHYHKGRKKRKWRRLSAPLQQHEGANPSHSATAMLPPQCCGVIGVNGARKKIFCR
jgi:hypothetical protein